MSQQERISWVSLAVTLFIAWWYFSRVLALPPDADLMGRALARFVSGLIGFAIIASILGEVVLRIAQRRARGGTDATAVDERDALIDLKATRNAHVVLVIGVATVLVQIVLVEWMQRGAGGARQEATTLLQHLATGPLSALHVAQMLLFVLTLASIAVYVSRIVCYRRGF